MSVSGVAADGDVANAGDAWHADAGDGTEAAGDRGEETGDQRGSAHAHDEEDDCGESTESAAPGAVVGTDAVCGRRRRSRLRPQLRIQCRTVYPKNKNDA